MRIILRDTQYTIRTMVTTVIFDLDDTLYDEIDYCRSGFAAVADFVAGLAVEPAVERIFAAFWRQFTAGNRKKIFNAGLDELGMDYDDKLVSELIKVYRNHVPKIKLPADSRNILRQLNEKYTLGLLTDGFLPAQRLKVGVLEIEKYFKSIVYTEELGRDCWKPSPAGLEKLMQNLNSKPQTTAYVADNEQKDFIAPNKLGILTIQITRPARVHTTPAAEPAARAQYVIREITELPHLFNKL